MPIIINRTGPLEVRETNPLTPQQKQELWENIVQSWCDKHPEQLKQLAFPVPAES